MSADNTIIILSLKDCYIVTHMGASDNLYFSYCEKYDNSPVPARIFEYFVDEKVFGGRGEAFIWADQLYNEIGYVEYGIQTIDISQYTWEDIKNQARQVLINEIDVLKKSKKYNDALIECESLLNLIDGKLTMEKWKEIRYN